MNVGFLGERLVWHCRNGGVQGVQELVEGNSVNFGGRPYGESFGEVFSQAVSTNPFHSEYLHDICDVAIGLQNLRYLGVFGYLHCVQLRR